MKKYAFMLMGILMIAVSFSGCSSKVTSIEELKQRGSIVMTTNAELEPFEYRDGNEIIGIDIDISKKIAESLGVELVVNDVSFDALIFELKGNKCDFVAAGMSYNVDRARNVSFSVPYFNASQDIVIRNDSDIKSAEDIKNKMIGVQLGTTSDSYCTENLKSSSVVRYNKSVDAVSDLINKRIDAVVVDDFLANKLIDKNPDLIKKLDERLTSEEYMLCVNKQNTELLNFINSEIENLKQTGELDSIIKKYRRDE